MPEKHASRGAHELPEHRVAGIAGVFFRARSAAGLRSWYVRNLGIDVDPSINGALFGNGGPGPHGDEPGHPGDEPGPPAAGPAGGSLLWSVYDRDATYFGDADQDWMISYRVSDLDALLAQLRAGGGQVGSDIEESEFGRFGWAYDPEGNRFELWEPRK